MTQAISVYRHNGSSVYHIPGRNYISRGEMLCGRIIQMPGFIANRTDLNAGKIPNRTLCKHCERKET